MNACLLVYISGLAFYGLLLQVVEAEDVCIEGSVKICSEDCKKVLFCPSPGAQPIDYETCFTDKNQLYCDRKKLDCSAKTCDAGQHPFICTGVATFPSAYDCKVSYLCGQDEKPIQQCSCGDGEYIDILSNSCKTISDTDVCPREPATCEYEGKQGTLDPQFCYVCQEDLNALVWNCGTKVTNRAPTAAKCEAYADPTSSPPVDDTTAGSTSPTEVTTTSIIPTTITPIPTSEEPPETTTSIPPTSTSEIPPTTAPTTPSTPTTMPPTATTPPTPTTMPPTATTPPTPSTMPPTATTPPTPSTMPPTATTPTPSTMPTTSTTQPTPTSSTTEAPPTDTPPNTCQLEGQRFPVRSNCHYFWLCKGSPPKPEMIQCKQDTHYDTQKMGCVTGLQC